MELTDKSGPASTGGPKTTPSPGSIVVPSVPPDSLGEPVSSDPSDPDAAMYAAIAARPDWTTKPAVRAAVAELTEGLRTGQDLLFWDVTRPGDVKPSDASEHLLIAVPQETDGQGSRGVELPSRRLYVAPAADPRRLATVRIPGRNGSRRAWLSRGAVALVVGSLAVTLGLIGLCGTPAKPPVRSEASTDPSGGPTGADLPRSSAGERSSNSERSSNGMAAAPVAATSTAAAPRSVPVVPARRQTGPLPPQGAPTVKVDTSRLVPPASAALAPGTEPSAPVKTRPKLPEQPDF